MKYKYFFILLIYSLFFKSIKLFPQDLGTILNKLENSTFKANLNIETKNNSISGKIYYQKGNLHFKLNDGRIIASNFRNIIIYDPETHVAGKQDKIPGGGISWILKFPYKIEGNKAIIEPENQKPYKKIIISWNSDNFPQLIQFISDDNTIIYRFSNITYLNNISSSLFSYKPPAGSRSVENPLNIKK